MEGSGSTTSGTQPPEAPPPPPADRSDDGKAGVGTRALAVLLALVLGFGAAVMIVASTEISDTPTLEEIESGEEPLPDDGEYFDGSEDKRTVVTILGYASGAFAALAALMALAFAITGVRGRLVVQTAGVAILLAVIVLII